MEHIAQWLGHVALSEDNKRNYKTTLGVHETWMKNHKELQKDVQVLNDIYFG